MKFSQMIEALQILAKYEEKGLDAFLAGADRDVVWAAGADVDEVQLPDDMGAYLDEHGEYPPLDDIRLSAEDNVRLQELGWFIDPEVGAWTSFC